MSYMKIEIWGTYPPPIGGVSIHIYRLIHSLHTIDSSVVLRNFGKQVSNISYVKHVSYPWMEFLLLPFRKKRIIHLHSNNIFAFALFLLFGGRHKVGVTLHNQNLIKKTSFIKKKIIQVFLRHAAFVVLNDDNYLLKLCSHFHCSRNNFHILPAFLPPTQAEYIGLSEDILFFRKQHSLKEKGINVGLVFCLPMIGDMEYYQKCLSSIKEMNIDDNILVVQREIPNGFEIWKLSDLFIRPTYTDIEGISVKEALFCGTPAVASDVCKRPSEAVLFKNRSYEDLEEKVLGFYNGSNYSSEGGISIDNRVPEQLLEIYEKCK